MMYGALCVCICLATLLITATLGAAVSAALAPMLLRFTRSWDPTPRAGALFACRLLPAAASLAVTAGLALPAFLVLEPAATSERVGLRLGVLAALGLAMISLTVFRLARVCVAGLGLTRRWKRQATLLPRFGPRMRVRQLPAAGGLVATTGIFVPTIFVSSEVVARLTAPELSAAIAHEVGHVRSRDNLKRLLIQALGWSWGNRVLTRRWASDCEIAADEFALRMGAPAVELASALLKVAQLGRSATSAATMASHLVPADLEGGLDERIRRLTSRLREEDRRVEAHTRLRGLPVAVGMTMLAAALAHPALLRMVHDLIEKLV